MLNSFDEWETRPLVRPLIPTTTCCFPKTSPSMHESWQIPELLFSQFQNPKTGCMQSGSSILKSTNARFDKDHPTGRILNAVASNVKALSALFLHARSPPRMGLVGKIPFCIMSRPGSLA
ncbi:hypothetical protein CEXT_70211 [Caerostris extrusa]|uniref:Uncharacterized protein n=1 Tax=Caerostris extrusa TaxID=172846 RepID=A0AAV4X663_CAEEX|nr:hypothetical protein CEXT_70211 [Caerostris extrusa]